MALPDYSLRPARAEDLGRLLEISIDGFRDVVDRIWGWDEAEHRRICTERFDPASTLVIEIGGEAAGELVVQRFPDQIHLKLITLAAEHRSQGIATEVVSGLLDEAKRERLPLTLRVLRFNRARKLYERLGLVVVQENEERFWMASDPDLPHEKL